MIYVLRQLNLLQLNSIPIRRRRRILFQFVTLNRVNYFLLFIFIWVTIILIWTLLVRIRCHAALHFHVYFHHRWQYNLRRSQIPYKNERSHKNNVRHNLKNEKSLKQLLGLRQQITTYRLHHLFIAYSNYRTIRQSLKLFQIFCRCFRFLIISINSRNNFRFY